MKKKKARKYFKKEWKVMVAHLNTYLKTTNQEELHQFRVQVKKLRALLVLLDLRDRHKKLVRCFKPVKKVFKVAGKLRDAYISGGLTNKKTDDEVLQNFQLIAVRYKNNIRKTRRDLKSELRPIKNKTLRQFYSSQLRLIADALAAQPSSQQLHNCRKLIKVLLYNYPLVHNGLMLDLDTAYLDQMQEMIGNWHDQLMAGTLTDSAVNATNQLAHDFYRRSVRQPDQGHDLS
jgi:CHAD domain-containing protein